MLYPFLFLNIISMKLDCIIIQFARLPELGTVKTRLQPELGELGCFELHQQLLKNVHDQVKLSGYFQVLSLNKLGSDKFVDHIALDTPLILQKGDDLGAKMHNAIDWGLTKANKVIVIGSDCAVLNANHIKQVADELNTHSHVLIPAEDGGYVLVAAKESYAPMFKDIKWGTGEVFEKTQYALHVGNKKAAYMPLLWDVDRAEDYKRLLKTYNNWPCI